MPSRPSWEGFITFNLISIPVKAFTATATGGGKIGFHMLHAKCNHRIKYKKVCPIHGEVSNDEIVMGYESAKDEYVPVKKEEREKLKEKDDRAISIDTFVAPDAIDPIYYGGRTYYLVPSGHPAQKPFAVLMHAMADHERHAIAEVVFSGRGHVAVLRPFGGILLMTLLSFESEIKPVAPFAAEVDDVSVGKEESKLASMLLESLSSKEFQISRYKDDYAVRLAKLIEKKSHGASRRVKQAEAPPVLDLMEALKKSLALHEKPVRKAVSRSKSRTSRKSVSKKPGRRTGS